MITITANQANEIANSVLQEREKDEKELQQAFNLIKERAWDGAFWVRTRECLSPNNIDILKRCGFDALNVYSDEIDPLHGSGTHISWYKN